MINNRKKQSGITLIALVVTIIVLLIFAGVVITMITGDNGILDRVAEAKVKTDQASENEESDLDTLASRINEATGNIPVIENASDLPTTEPVKVKTKYIDSTSTNYANHNTVVIPGGFKVSSDSKEQKIDDGFVIIDKQGNEFVWVPVEDINSMYGETANGKKIGKLYKFISANVSENTANNWEEDTAHAGKIKWSLTSGDSSKREPDILTSTTWGDKSTTTSRGLYMLKDIIGIEGTIGRDNNAMINNWQKMLQNDFDEMIKNVGRAGGFYIGRYETSLNSDKTKVQSKKGVEATEVRANTMQNWYGCYKLLKSYSNNNVGSSMIWGCQYDQMMIWMQKNGYDVSKAEPKTGVTRDTGVRKITGKTTIDIVNNIYDLLGNYMEWTMEASNNERRTYRSGDYMLSGSRALASRGALYPIFNNGGITTRIALFIK